MNSNIIGEIRDANNRDKLLGSCFLINKSFLVTAAHVIKDIESIECLEVYFKFINLKRKIIETIYFDLDNIDLVILKLDKDIENKIEFVEVYSNIALECGDRWETIGYPEDFKYESSDVNKYTYINGEISREIDNEKCDFELFIYGQKELTDWQGLSGAPVIVNNKIVGIVIQESISKLLKAKIKMISMQKVIEFLYDNNKLDILKLISYREKNLLNDRMDEFNKKCEENFICFNYKTEEFTSECLVLRKGARVKEFVELIDYFFCDYASKIQDMILLEDKELIVRRKQKKYIEEIASELKEQLIKDNKISLALLWIILEGKYKSPRLATTYSFNNSDLRQDIYSYDGNRLVIGYAEMQEEFLDSIEISLKEIETDRELECNNERIIVWDELALNYIDLFSKLKIEKNRREKIELEVVLLHSYNSEIYTKSQYKRDGDNFKIVEDIMNKEFHKYNQDISYICSKYKWIKSIKINWISLPIDSVVDFSNFFKENN